MRIEMRRHMMVLRQIAKDIEESRAYCYSRGKYEAEINKPYRLIEIPTVCARIYDLLNTKIDFNRHQLHRTQFLALPF
jgi:hypothetical protein